MLIEKYTCQLSYSKYIKCSQLSVLIMFLLPKYQVGRSKDCQSAVPVLKNPSSPVLVVRSSQILSEVVVMVTALHSLPLVEFPKHLDMQSWILFAARCSNV